jgi:hypothetical protein
MGLEALYWENPSASKCARGELDGKEILGYYDSFNIVKGIVLGIKKTKATALFLLR